MSKNKEKKFYVVRSMWDGNKQPEMGGGSLLHHKYDVEACASDMKNSLNPVQMCCLGHICLQKGVSGTQLLDTAFPIATKFGPLLGEEKDIGIGSINDNTTLLPKQKEKLLRERFAEEGIKLEFVDTIHNLPNKLRIKYSRLKKIVGADK